MNDVEIWHNPRCSKSRQALELLRGRDIEPTVVLYLEATLNRARIEEVLKLLGLEPRAIMRTGEASYKELGLANHDLSRDELVAALIEHPILIERPIVIAGNKAVIGRPPERVLDIL